MYQHPGFADTVDADQNKDHYYTMFTSANPNQVIPLGSSVPRFKDAHDREEKFSKENLQVQKDRFETNKAAEEEDQGAEKDKRVANGEFVRGVSGHRDIIRKGEKGRYI